MVLTVVFGAALLVAVLLSGLAARSVFSTSLLFLAGGALVSDGFLGLVHIDPGSDVVRFTADLALFAVLFTDGAHVSFPALRRGWRHPARALGLGMPLAFLGIALLTHYLAGLDWLTSFLVGAVLAPTDPVFASALVSRTEVPRRLRQLLNVESGVNDGLALPFVLVLIAAIGPTRDPGADTEPAAIAAELGLGLAMGVALPLLVRLLTRARALGAEVRLQPLLPCAVGVTLYALCHVLHANPYLAAFAAGAVLAAVSPDATRAFGPMGESLTELAKFAALLVFGALLTPKLLGELTLGAWAVVPLVILLVRPVTLTLSLAGTEFGLREKLAAGWFGPKGFASVVYGLLALKSGIPQGEEAFVLVAAVIAFSVVVHSTTDAPLARMFHVEELAGLRDDGALGESDNGALGEGDGTRQESGGARQESGGASRAEDAT
ncbi:cation:proton antiporter [Streptomyces iconiensis]|uniref:Cation:proton antiporter n=1 Tax=Streptomyces iconiensis TaxID=1384038 RepID=A0ABT7A722_9ACTN|nr:cation:proton antiporter [Streptomyces iconiensis]MDJ1137123.1 cation:proton antiporter [Streptomyces iconiensis]